MNEMEFQDQTFFSANQPILDDGDDFQIQENEKQTPVRSKKKIVIIIVSLIVLVFTLVGMLMLTNRSNVVDDSSTTVVPSASPTTIKTDDIVFERLDQLKEEINNAEPRSDKLPFPPVKMDINLEDN